MKRGNRIILAGVVTLVLGGCASSEKTGGADKARGKRRRSSDAAPSATP